MFRASRVLGCLVIFGWLATAANAWDVTAWRPWPFNADEKPAVPDRVLSSWTEATASQAGQTPIRGFGGRLMFFEGKKEKPIKVEGTLVIYAFDETGRDPSNTKPDRKYVFTPEQLPAHYSKSKIGHSYSVWLPWDEVGGMQKEVTLVVRFEPKAGAVVLGEQCRQLLSGIVPPQTDARGVSQPSAASYQASPAGGPVNQTVWSNQRMALGQTPVTNAGGVQPVSYEAAIPQGNSSSLDNNGQPRRMTTTTIAMSADMAARQAALGPGTASSPVGNRQPSAAVREQLTGRLNPQGLVTGSPPVSQTLPANSAPPMSLAPPQVGFQPARYPLLDESRVRPDHDRAVWQQRPLGLQSGPVSQPGPAYSNGQQAGLPAAGQAPN